MNPIDTNRRNFMKKAGGSLIALTAGSGLALSAMGAHAAQAAVYELNFSIPIGSSTESAPELNAK